MVNAMKKYVIEVTNLRKNIAEFIQASKWEYERIDGVFFENEEDADLARILFNKAQNGLYARWITLES